MKGPVGELAFDLDPPYSQHQLELELILEIAMTYSVNFRFDVWCTLRISHWLFGPLVTTNKKPIASLLTPTQNIQSMCLISSHLYI